MTPAFGDIWADGDEELTLCWDTDTLRWVTDSMNAGRYGPWRRVGVMTLTDPTWSFPALREEDAR